ncbi:hypothetical protein ACPCG0_03030 [Propionibacteriaceae bacterium Y1923]
MRTAARVTRWTAFILTGLFVALATLFALGYAFEDLPLGSALLVTAANVLPLAALVVAVRVWPARAPMVLGIGIALVLVWGVVSNFVEADFPVLPMMTLILALPIAVMGLSRPSIAGMMLLALAAIPFLSLVVRLVRMRGPEGPGMRTLLSTSSGAVIVPLALFSVLFLVAGELGRRIQEGHGLGEQARPWLPDD